MTRPARVRGAGDVTRAAQAEVVAGDRAQSPRVKISETAQFRLLRPKPRNQLRQVNGFEKKRRTKCLGVPSNDRIVVSGNHDDAAGWSLAPKEMGELQSIEITDADIRQQHVRN